MIANLPLKCDCGLLTGVIEGVASDRRNRFSCLCDDCQAFAVWLGKKSSILDQDGGTEILPIVPPRLKILTGLEHLKSMKLSPSGMDRWFAGCCKTPIANTANSKMPFAGVIHSIIYVEGQTREDLMGPLVARIQGKYGKQPLLPGTYKGTPARVMWTMIRFMVPAFLKKQNWPTPFYSIDGSPVVEPYVLKKEERESLRAQTGSKLIF